MKASANFKACFFVGFASKDVIIGNVTVCRFKTEPSQAFFEEFERIKDRKIGEFVVNEVALVVTNAVCYKDKTKIINRYRLR